MFVAYLFVRDWQTGELTVRCGTPTDKKYVYTIRKDKNIKVKCTHTLLEAKRLAEDIKKGKADSLDYPDYFFYFSSTDVKVDVYKYLDVEGVEFALVGFDRHHPRMSSRVSAFVPALYLFDTIPVHFDRERH